MEKFNQQIQQHRINMASLRQSYIQMKARVKQLEEKDAESRSDAEENELQSLLKQRKTVKNRFNLSKSIIAETNRKIINYEYFQLCLKLIIQASEGKLKHELIDCTRVHRNIEFLQSEHLGINALRNGQQNDVFEVLPRIFDFDLMLRQPFVEVAVQYQNHYAQCSSCQEIVLTGEKVPCDYLGLALPEPNSDTYIPPTGIKIKTLMEQFQSKTQLVGANARYCAKEKKKCDATSWTIPLSNSKYFIITFLRYLNNSHKNVTNVHLDPVIAVNDLNDISKLFYYELSHDVMHDGTEATVTVGHVTVEVTRESSPSPSQLSTKKYFSCNDQFISELKQLTPFGSQPYIVFYRKFESQSIGKAMYNKFHKIQ